MNTNPPIIDKNVNSAVFRRANEILHSVIKNKYSSIEAFSQKIGMSRSTVSKIIHGHIIPSNEQKIKIAKELGWDSRELWRDK